MAGAPWGGSEELWSQAALLMRRQGFTVGVSVIRWPEVPEPIKALAEAGCVVERRDLWPRWYFRALHAVANTGGQRGDRKWLKNFAPDLAVISQGENSAGLSWMTICQELEIPYCVLSHNANYSLWPNEGTLALLRDAYLRARRSLFVSEEMKRITCMQIGAELTNASIVRNPIRVSRYAPPVFPSHPPFVLACVGRLDVAQKGQDLLFEALSQEKWRTRPLKVEMFGSGPHEKGLQRLKDYLNLDMVEFRGFVDDPNDVWARAHGLVLPSRFEGFPIVLVEAMMCNRMAIVTDIADNRAVVEEGVTGFVAHAPTSRMIDEALERAWATRLSWADMGIAAGRRIREIVPEDPVGSFVRELTR